MCPPPGLRGLSIAQLVTLTLPEAAYGFRGRSGGGGIRPTTITAN